MGVTVVWARIEEKGRRKVGIRWWVWRWVDRASWSKMLFSEDWTMKRMHCGSLGEVLGGP